MKHKAINMNTFEALIVDYFDGKLSENEQQSLFAFLEEHPQFINDFELFKETQETVLQSDTPIFPNPEKLKKNAIVSVNDMAESNYQECIIAFHENDLDESARKTFSLFLEKNPSLLTEFENFGELRLVPDKTIVFKDTQRLKHTPFRLAVVMWTAFASVAAVLLLFFLFRPLNNMPSTSQSPRPHFVQTCEDEPKTISETSETSPLPVDEIIPQQKSNVNPSPISSVAQAEKAITPDPTPNEEFNMEHLTSEESTGVLPTYSFDVIKVLEPDAVFIKTILEPDPTTTDDLLVSYQERRQKKSPLLNLLSWGIKQYNYIAKDEVSIMKVESLTTNETVYYLCRRED